MALKRPDTCDFAAERMKLQLALPAKSVVEVNPRGTVAVCSLWTPVDYLKRTIGDRVPALLDEDGPIALMGGLYGGGLSVMLRNLHHNPQIDTVVVCGKDFSGAGVHLANFLQGKIDRTGAVQRYVFDDGREEELEKISVPGPFSAYVMDGLLLPEGFERPPAVIDLTEAEGRLPERLLEFFSSYEPRPGPESRPGPVPLPRPVVDTRPSDIFSFVISEGTITEAWTELLSTLARFGRPVSFRNGKERLELLNVKAVVHEPGKVSETDLTRLDLSAAALESYKSELIRPDLKDGMSYTYGHRLRSYFGRDLLMEAVRDLALAGDRRHAYISLWDNLRDLGAGDAPCLASLFFRKIGPRVNLSAVFRSHNAARAWPVNCFGLYGLMEFACREANNHPGRTEPETLLPGTLVVTSMSISLDPADLGQVGGIIKDQDSRAYAEKLDPRGFFRISVDLEAKDLVAHHHAPDGELLAEYRAKRPSEMGWLLQRAKAVSDIGHAMYLGSQLERAWYYLSRGMEYVQDKSKLAD